MKAEEEDRRNEGKKDGHEQRETLRRSVIQNTEWTQVHTCLALYGCLCNCLCLNDMSFFFFSWSLFFPPAREPVPDFHINTQVSKLFFRPETGKKQQQKTPPRTLEHTEFVCFKSSQDFMQ